MSPTDLVSAEEAARLLEGAKSCGAPIVLQDAVRRLAHTVIKLTEDRERWAGEAEHVLGKLEEARAEVERLRQELELARVREVGTTIMDAYPKAFAELDD